MRAHVNNSVPAKRLLLALVHLPLTAARGARDGAGKELHRQVQSHPPSFLIVRGVRKTQMNQIPTVSPAPADQGKRHLHRYFVIVARPPAVEIKSDVALRLAQHPLDQVVLIGEGTRHTGGGSEYVGILPDGVERDYPA